MLKSILAGRLLWPLLGVCKFTLPGDLGGYGCPDDRRECVGTKVEDGDR